ncbi:MAG: serine/threonine-protein kinase, partial [Thermoanaerobaculia bacterium]|nr:serine/threonine-protein kinase [Thermoanaerobaculia bacterium]
MGLEAGARLGGYDVVEPLGAGGMGEVYRARDLKLGRQVALKILLEEVSQDPDRLARFEREARVLASLNHPNIATLYGLEKDGEMSARPDAAGVSFLVMELVEGETLADRIARGPIPIAETVPIFLQIAEGLDAAHQRGIVHRDLKPANIKLGGDDSPLKILDFGLAKATATVGTRSADVSASMSPTLTLAATQSGEVMGTAAYMSPEQAKGHQVDRRTDVWAFGACLMEALSGQRAFPGEDASELMGAVLMREPRWEALPD